MSRIVQKRQVEPWLQIDWLFHMSPNGTEHKKCLSILHGFTDQVTHIGRLKTRPFNINKLFYNETQMIRERKIEHKLRKSQKEEKDVSKKDDDTFIFSKQDIQIMN